MITFGAVNKLENVYIFDLRLKEESDRNMSRYGDTSIVRPFIETLLVIIITVTPR